MYLAQPKFTLPISSGGLESVLVGQLRCEKDCTNSHSKRSVRRNDRRQKHSTVVSKTWYP